MAFDEAAVASRAQRVISRAMRARPPDIRVCLPFDPCDPQDVKAWVDERLRERQWKEGDTAAFAVTRLLWLAQKTGRRVSLRALCGYKHPDPTGPTQASRNYEFELAPQQNSHDWEDAFEVAEEFLECAVLAMERRLASRSIGAPRQIGALLTCLGRLVWAVKSALPAEIVNLAIDEVATKTAFTRLPLDIVVRTRFVSAMKQLSTTGNMRRDLAGCGWSSPGLAQWTAYVCAFRNFLIQRNEIKGDIG